jgi:HEAT repeat protein
VARGTRAARGTQEARRRRKTTRARNREAIATYRASLAVAGLLVGLLVFLVILTIQRDTLTPALDDLAAHPTTLAQDTVATLGLFFGLPLAAALGSSLGLAVLIAWMRLWIYVRGVRRHARRYLRIHLPPGAAQVRPRARRRDGEGAFSGGEALALDELFKTSRQVMLLGEAGAGKTVALHQIARRLTRRRMLPLVFLGLAPLPILLPLASFPFQDSDDGLSLVRHLARQVGIFSTRGLVARLPRRLRRRTLLLCDGLDDVPAGPRRELCAQLAALANTPPRRMRLLVTTGLETYRREPGTFAPLHGFDHWAAEGLREDEIVRALAALRPVAGAARPSRAEIAKWLRTHALHVSAGLPATLAALCAVWAGGGELPHGRSMLWRELLALRAGQIDAMIDAGIGAGAEAAAHEGTLVVLGRLASSLRRAGMRVIAVDPSGDMGQAVADWLAEEPPLTVTEASAPASDEMDPDRVEAICRAALRVGMLRRTADGLALGFAHGPLEAAFAATRLHAADDGIGRLNAELLRYEWMLPVLLWAGLAAPDAADLVTRLSRVGDTPETTAMRAGLAAPGAVEPRTLALALAALAEDVASALAGGAAQPRRLALMEQHLRDALDRAQRYSAQAGGADRLAGELGLVAEAGGLEVSATLAVIASHPALSRLVRAQAITLLGLLATPAALEAITGLLDDPDPVIRQAEQQAIMSAGYEAIAPLRAALGATDERVRTRAGDALALLGGAAAEAALAALDGADAGQRAAAARTLGALRALEAEKALIARLDDSDVTVAEAAALALGRLRSPSAAAALATRAAAAKPPVRAAIAEALGACGEQVAYDPLVEMLDDAEGAVRAAAAHALGQLGDARAVGPLNAHRHDADPWAQNAVVAALRRLGERG